MSENKTQTELDLAIENVRICYSGRLPMPESLNVVLSAAKRCADAEKEVRQLKASRALTDRIFQDDWKKIQLELLKSEAEQRKLVDKLARAEKRIAELESIWSEASNKVDEEVVRNRAEAFYLLHPRHEKVDPFGHEVGAVIPFDKIGNKGMYLMIARLHVQTCESIRLSERARIAELERVGKELAEAVNAVYVGSKDSTNPNAIILARETGKLVQLAKKQGLIASKARQQGWIGE